jgi:hypothetical protein
LPPCTSVAGQLFRQKNKALSQHLKNINNLSAQSELANRNLLKHPKASEQSEHLFQRLQMGI